jgi:hypothetical protein
MDFDLTDGVAVLTRTPSVLMSLLSGLPDEWTRQNEGEGTWSPYDVVGHLIHGERTDWMPRVRMILEAGDTKPFEPFDRVAMFEASKGLTVDELLATFADLRRQGLAALAAFKLTPQDLQRVGRHPALGRVTLAQLLASWVAHDLGHIVQIARTMGRQYETAVGPWKEYLTVVRLHTAETSRF